jgi:uncharacterized protein (DUF433 family)
MVDQAPALDLSKYIEVRLFGERPHIRGRRVPVAVIAHSAQSQNWGITELAYNFSLSEAEVLSALLYYEENKAAIEALEAQEQWLLDEMYQRYGGT